MNPDINWAIQQKAPWTCKAVLFVLSNRADKNHQCYPSLTSLASDTGLHRRTVIRCIQKLEKLGLIRCDRHGTTGTIYTLQVVTDGHQDKGLNAATGLTRLQVTRSHQRRRWKVTSRKKQLVTPCPPASDSVSTQLVTQRHTNPNIEPKENPKYGDAGLGEFHSVRLEDPQIAKLQAKLNGNFQHYIDRLDRYSQTHPKEFAKYRSHYAVLLGWYDRDVIEGKIKPQAVSYTPEQIAERVVQLRKEGLR